MRPFFVTHLVNIAQYERGGSQDVLLCEAALCECDQLSGAVRNFELPWFAFLKWRIRHGSRFRVETEKPAVTEKKIVV